LLLIGIGMAQSSKKLFKKVGTNVNTFEKPDKLITIGFYKFSRNPMYLGFAVALLGTAILYQGAISSLLLLFLFIVIVDRWYIRHEEKLMLEKFGKEYTKYCIDTRKWI
jgi:protein-S-isoprenylcysteine O-methyltransferase Ste14